MYTLADQGNKSRDTMRKMETNKIAGIDSMKKMEKK